MTHTSNIKIGTKVKLKGNVQGTVKYIGLLAGKKKDGIYYGIVLKTKSGDTNGTIKKKKYFQCKPKYGLFVQRLDIIDPVPVIFNKLCDRTLHIVTCILFEYFDGCTLANFCNVGNGITRIIFNIDKTYNLTFKRVWKLFVSPHSEEDNLRTRFKKLNKMYEEKIFHWYSSKDLKDFEFGVFKISNVKDKNCTKNPERAMILLKIALHRLSCKGRMCFLNLQKAKSLKFDEIIQKVKLETKKTKFIKTEQDAALNINVNVTEASIYYEHINCYADIFDTKKMKNAIPFKRKYHRHKGAFKEFKSNLQMFLMPNLLELGNNGVKQWFVVHAIVDGDYYGNNWYIIGWITSQKLIVIGGAIGSLRWEKGLDKPPELLDSDGYWSLSM
eukprot:341134_1